MGFNIAIDGPAGAGKSTIARIIAKKIGFIYVDTGALYRAVGYFVKQNGIGSKDEEKIKPLLNNIKVELKFIDFEQRVFLNDEDISDKIRTPELSMIASDVSSLKSVRDFLFDLQRDIAEKNDIIMDGRDIGTVVLPNAQLKIFLTATPEDRAKRRFEELTQKGMDVSYDDILEDIKFRDHNDSTREIAPLKQASDAILVDTTQNELEVSIAILTKLIKENLE
jgi:cytidylate kinase